MRALSYDGAVHGFCLVGEGVATSGGEEDCPTHLKIKTIFFSNHGSFLLQDDVGKLWKNQGV